MKAIGKCPKCEEVITTDCRACIEGVSCVHKCVNGKLEVVDGIKWKKVPETEKELGEVDEN